MIQTTLSPQAQFKQQALGVIAGTFDEFNKPENAANTRTLSATGNNSGFSVEEWISYCTKGQEKPLPTFINVSAVSSQMKARIIGYNFKTTIDPATNQKMFVLDAEGKKIPQDKLNLVDMPIIVVGANGEREEKLIQVAEVVGAVIFRDLLKGLITKDTPHTLKLTINNNNPDWCRTRLYNGTDFGKVTGDVAEKYEDIQAEIKTLVAALPDA